MTPGDPDLRGRVALVSGAASGIGRETAVRLAAAGARVVALDRDVAGLADTAGTVRAAGGECDVQPVDLERDPDVVDAAAAVVDRLGRVDVLVNCAGIVGPRAALVDLADSDVDRVLRVNLVGALRLTRAVLPALIAAAPGGRIVTVSSASASRAHAYSVPYAASKAALEGATRALAGELAPHDITVNAVAPGVTATNIHGTGDTAADRARRATEGAVANLFGRASEPADIAASILFLCGPGARQITGQVLHVSAGAIV